MERYCFYGRLNPLFPSQVVVDVANVCNLRCVSCTQQEKSRQPGYRPTYLSLELNKKMVDEVREYSGGIAQYIRYTADGEPLLHPQLDELLEYSCRHSGTNTVLTTNGTLLDRKIGERLLAMGLLFIDISIDAFSEEAYNCVRGKGYFKKVRDNVLDLINTKKETGSATRIVVSFVEQPLNAGESDDFKSYWEENGADYVIIRRLHSYAGQKNEIADKMKANPADRTPCAYPWERIVLKYNGNLTFCPACPGDIFIADYNLATIRETWSGEAYRALRQAHLDNHFEKHGFCGNCPDWQLIKWPDEGRSYASLVEDFDKDK